VSDAARVPWAAGSIDFDGSWKPRLVLLPPLTSGPGGDRDPPKVRGFVYAFVPNAIAQIIST